MAIYVSFQIDQNFVNGFGLDSTPSSKTLRFDLDRWRWFSTLVDLLYVFLNEIFSCSSVLQVVMPHFGISIRNCRRCSLNKIKWWTNGRNNFITNTIGTPVFGQVKFLVKVHSRSVVEKVRYFVLGLKRYWNIYSRRSKYQPNISVWRNSRGIIVGARVRLQIEVSFSSFLRSRKVHLAKDLFFLFSFSVRTRSVDCGKNFESNVRFKTFFRDATRSKIQGIPFDSSSLVASKWVSKRKDENQILTLRSRTTTDPFSFFFRSNQSERLSTISYLSLGFARLFTLTYSSSFVLALTELVVSALSGRLYAQSQYQHAHLNDPNATTAGAVSATTKSSHAEVNWSTPSENHFLCFQL